MGDDSGVVQSGRQIEDVQTRIDCGYFQWIDDEEKIPDKYLPLMGQRACQLNFAERTLIT